jgi:hypothetical protein
MQQKVFQLQLFKSKQLHPETHSSWIGNQIFFFQILFVLAFRLIKMTLNSIKPLMSLAITWKIVFRAQPIPLAVKKEK